MDASPGDPRRLNLHEIVQAAQTATNLRDMGEPDILPAVQRLIDSLLNEAKLHAQGVEMQRATLINLLSNRLRIEDTFKRHPEILNEEIRGPIVITGLARSGTTKMQRMIAADPQLQKLPLWRLMNPISLGPTPLGGVDLRITATEQLSAMMRDRYPDFYAGHPMNATEPDEEAFMAELAMRGSFNSHATRVPTFHNWMDSQDYTPWYVFLYKMLQFYQWEDGSPKKTWLLKAPAHLGFISTLFKIFPNATLVTCHRDPVTTIASIAKLSAEGMRMYSDHIVAENIGRFELESWSRHFQRYMAQRPALETAHRFVDIPYVEITGNAITGIERVYAAADSRLTSNSRAAMQQWEVSNPPGKHGRHSYSLEWCGLTADEVRAAFATYLERFGHLV